MPPEWVNFVLWMGDCFAWAGSPPEGRPFKDLFQHNHR